MERVLFGLSLSVTVSSINSSQPNLGLHLVVAHSHLTEAIVLLHQLWLGVSEAAPGNSDIDCWGRARGEREDM